MLPLSLIPAVIPGTTNDASQIVETWNALLPDQRTRSLHELSWASVRGQRPQEYDEFILLTALEPVDNSPEELRANFLAYVKAQDEKSPDVAATYLDRCLEIIAQYPDKPEIGQGTYVEAAYFEARYGQDPIRAHGWLKLELLFETEAASIYHEQAMLRTEAAILLAEKELTQAKEKAASSFAYLETFTDIGNAKFEEDWLKEIMTELARS